MHIGVGEVTRRKGRDSISLKLKKGIITYQKHMGRVDHEKHHRVMWIGFENAAHYKEWCKK